MPDTEIEKRTKEDILEYKARNQKLFERFSYSVRQLVAQIKTMPASKGFEDDLQEMIDTEVWRERETVADELRSAWEKLFKSTIEPVVSGAVAVGITPFLSLGSVTVASLVTGAVAVAPWLASESIKFLDNRKRAQEHGLYYLMKFSV